MDKTAKHNVIVGAVLSVAAVIVIWYFLNPPAAQAATDTPSLTATPPPDPSYVSYNIPSYDPAPPEVLGPDANVNGNNGGGNGNGGNGCCPGCAPNGNTSSTPLTVFQGLIGIGLEQGGAFTLG